MVQFIAAGDLYNIRVPCDDTVQAPLRDGLSPQSRLHEALRARPLLALSPCRNRRMRVLEI
jgi:hypothetical protein